MGDDNQLQSRKRLRDEDRDSTETLAKKVKHVFPTLKDSVADYLPEVLPKPQNPGLDASLTAIKPSVEDIFEHLKKSNTLAVLDTSDKRTSLFKKTLTWMVDQENLRREKGFSSRVAFLITAPDTPCDEQSLPLQKLGNSKISMITDTVSNRIFGHKLVEEDLIIMPANIFLDSLACGALSFSQVNLLVLQDVDMIGDAHPMARVMKEFYNSSPPEERPRILGLISLGVNSTIPYDIGMLKLEKLLNATVLGVSSELRDAIMALPDKPTEMILFYYPHFSIGKVDTPLLQQLRRVGPTMEAFKKQFKSARYVASELGTCASDLVWRKTLREMENQPDLHLDNEDDDDIVNQQDAASRKDLEVQKKVYNIIKNWIFALPNLDHTSRGYNVTPKLVKLVQILKTFEPHGESFRGIIFVHRRSVAHALCDILRVLGDYLAFIRPQALTGHNSSTDSHIQQDVLEDFRIGTINVLVATKFAEDLEIPSCTCVIRFNIFESLVSYAYSRACTRGSESHLIHMAERGNDVHRRILSEIASLDISMERWIESISRGPESSIPPSTLKETSDPYRSDSDDDDEEDFVQDPTASGRIYIHDATTVLYRFLAYSLPADRDILLKRPLFKFQQLRGHGSRNMHICTVLMPPDFLIPSISGLPYPTQSAARRAACLRACEELFNRGFLDYNFFPRPPSVTVRPQRTSYASTSMMEDVTDDDDDNPLLHRKKSSGTRLYYRRKPDFWSNTTGIFNGRLYPTVIDVDFPEESTEKYGSLLFLTRLPLPRFDPFKLFHNGVPFKIRMIRAAPFEVDQNQLQLLHRYTLRLCRTISNKPFVATLEETLYFLAPLAPTWNASASESEDTWDLPDVWTHIPWDSVVAATKNWAVALRRESTENLISDIQDAVIQDRWVEFTRRYYVTLLRQDLNPMSKPDGSCRESGSASFFEYCKERRKGFELLEDYSQPMMEVERVPAITNLLNPSSRTSSVSAKKGSAKYLIPELCCKLTVPASVIRTALLMPSITRRLDDILLVKDLNAKLFDHCINETVLHEAISTPSVSAEYDYERLELLGDAYLKYLSSVYLFVTQPSLHEGALHIARQRIISNRSLLKNADRSGLPQYIQSKPFTCKTWIPPNFKVFRPPKPIIIDDELQDEEPEKSTSFVIDIKDQTMETKSIGAEPSESKTVEEIVQPSRTESSIDKEGKKKHIDSNTQKLGDKAVADVAEAIIGAAYITMGREVALKVTKALNIPVPHIDRWTDFARKTLAPPPEAFAPLKPGTVEHIEKAIGHSFKRPHLLAQALTHVSIQGHETTSYERLEFIGDAILDFLVIRYIFNRDGNLSPGILTLLKSAMVANSTLAAVCVYSGFHEYLIFESQTIANSITQYSEALRNAERADATRAKFEGSTPGQYWLDIEQPKVLSDVLESVMGAVYVSDNFSSVGVEAFFDNILKPFFDKHITLNTLSHHPTKVLFELFQSIGCQEFLIDKYLDPEKPGIVTCDVVCHDIILATADDPATQLAARKASFLALDALQGDAKFLTTTCSCRANTNDTKKKVKNVQQQVKELENSESEVKP